MDVVWLWVGWNCAVDGVVPIGSQVVSGNVAWCQSLGAAVEPPSHVLMDRGAALQAQGIVLQSGHTLHAIVSPLWKVEFEIRIALLEWSGVEDRKDLAGRLVGDGGDKLKAIGEWRDNKAVIEGKWTLYKIEA